MPSAPGVSSVGFAMPTGKAAGTKEPECCGVVLCNQRIGLAGSSLHVLNLPERDVTVDFPVDSDLLSQLEV